MSHTTTHDLGEAVRHWRRYCDRKDSGIDWIGEIPQHWTIKKLKYVASSVDAKTQEKPPDRPYIGLENIESATGKLLFGSPVEQVDSAVAHFQAGDVLFGKLRPYLAKVLMVEFQGVCSTEILVFRPTRDVEARYMVYGLLSDGFIRQVDSTTYGVKMPRANPGQVSNSHLVLPPPEEQRRIVAFLDSETAKINILIAKKERLIELLQEQRVALVSQAVTKGVDPTVSMKDSGVPWLGRMPAHWDVIQSRRVFKVRNDPAAPSDRQLTASQKHGMLFQSDFVELEGRRVVETIKGVDSLRRVEPDDFVISLRSFQGGIEWSRLRGSVTFHYIVLRPVKPLHPAFFGYLFKSIAYIQALRATTDFIRDGQDLRYSHFTQVPLPVVPLQEQAAIAAYLDRETVRLDLLINASQQTINKLREFRAALIAAAVTGKIDVREEVP